jgi:hypothetical protein
MREEAVTIPEGASLRRVWLRSTSGPPLTWLPFVASSPVNKSAIAE